MSANRNDIEETFLTVAEVAEKLKLNQQTVRNWIDQGSLPALRMGRRVRIKRSDFDRVVAESYNAGGAGSRPEAGPSAEDFWGGEPVGLAEPALPEAVSGTEPALAEAVGGTEPGLAEAVRLPEPRPAARDAMSELGPSDDRR